MMQEMVGRMLRHNHSNMPLLSPPYSALPSTCSWPRFEAFSSPLSYNHQHHPWRLQIENSLAFLHDRDWRGAELEPMVCTSKWDQSPPTTNCIYNNKLNISTLDSDTTIHLVSTKRKVHRLPCFCSSFCT